MAQRKKKNNGKRVNRSPYDLLQAEYEKSQLRAVPVDDGYLDALVSQGPAPVQDTVKVAHVEAPSTAPVSASTPPALVPLLLTMAQVCELLNVSRTTFYRMRQDGEVPGAVTVGGQARYHRETIEKWILQKMEPSP